MMYLFRIIGLLGLIIILLLHVLKKIRWRYLFLFE